MSLRERGTRGIAAHFGGREMGIGEAAGNDCGFDESSVEEGFGGRRGRYVGGHVGRGGGLKA